MSDRQPAQPDEIHGKRAALFELWTGNTRPSVVHKPEPPREPPSWLIDIEADSFEFWD